MSNFGYIPTEAIVKKYGSIENYKLSISKKLSGKHFWTNGEIDRKFYDYEQPPEGWWKGRTNCGKGTKGYFFINNGKEQTQIPNSSEIPDGWVKGALPNTDEQNLKIAKALKNYIKTEEHCKNLSLSHQTKEYDEKIRKTNLEKYGVECQWQRPEIVEKNHSPEVEQKKLDTKRKNGTFNSSKWEDNVYNYLLNLFNDVRRGYNLDNRYPFQCDFYIPQLDLFIECNFHWTHGGHWFNGTDIADTSIINKWKEKNTLYFDIAIDVWTRRDLLKRDTAIKNGINYIVLFNYKTFIDDFNKNLNDLHLTLNGNEE